MYITNVIPLIKIPHPNPQILSYFCSEKIPIGGLVRISLRKKKIRAVVVEQKKIEQEKIRLKKFADFTIKPIEKTISKKPFLTKNQLKLLFWIADYYFAPLGIVAKIFLSKNYEIRDTKYQIRNLTLTPKTKALVFAPFKNLTSITIEDEESPLYRSWGRRPYYNAKDIAIQLAKIHKAKLTLKSEFYKLPKLKIKKHIIDMREEIKNGNLSIISYALEEKLRKYKKIILYITRRGTATFILCRECGYVAQCSECDVPMVFHENIPKKRLLCHHCGKQDIAPVLCPNCRSLKIKYFGAGTQKVETEVKKLFPEATVLRLDSDIAEKPAQQQKITEKFNRSKKAILIGSQMLFNKELKADLVAVISLETILNLPDFRSSERVFRIINQLQKMAKKEFLLQTYNPDNYTIKSALASDFKGFYNEQLKIRKVFNYPPFSQIIKLTFEHKDPDRAKEEAKILVQKLNQQIKYQIRNTKYQIQLMGPAPAFITKIKRMYRWNIVIKSKIKDLKKRNKLLMIVPPTWNIEVDPESLL